jgi:hypothetical protein
VAAAHVSSGMVRPSVVRGSAALVLWCYWGNVTAALPPVLEPEGHRIAACVVDHKVMLCGTHVRAHVKPAQPGLSQAGSVLGTRGCNDVNTVTVDAQYPGLGRRAATSLTH